MDSGFQVLDSSICLLSVQLGFWIPNVSAIFFFSDSVILVPRARRFFWSRDLETKG